VDLYEPGTQRERGYMHGISSVFKDDCISDGAEIASRAIEKGVHPIELDMLDQGSSTQLLIRTAKAPTQSQITTIVVDTGDEYDRQDTVFELDSQYIDLDTIEFS
jgi:hypothetical protein